VILPVSPSPGDRLVASRKTLNLGPGRYHGFRNRLRLSSNASATISSGSVVYEMKTSYRFLSPTTPTVVSCREPESPVVLAADATVRQDERVTAGATSLPTGVVTFLLTDIEGSTRAWQESPAQMTELVSEHYGILDEVIATHGGRRPQEQGEGDSVVAVFTEQPAAIGAAVDAQRRLRERLPSLPVRMAIHTGDALLRDADNYVGLTIIRCARIRGAGHGGQILLSEEAVGGLDGVADADAVELGQFGLRGLDGRERIWQLVHPDLPRSFPPLKAGSSAHGNLPVPVTSFVGRRRELATVGDLLADHRVLSLTGGAGIGKSRLLNAAADAGANALPGGVWWVPMHDVQRDDLDALAATTIRTCSIAETAATPVEAVIDHFDRIADALLVLDAVDAAPAAAAALVERIVARCPDVRVATTGRRPLGLPGVFTHDVEPLGLPAEHATDVHLHDHDATRLFVERAVASAGTMVGTNDTGDVVRLCRRLGGNPLAIELAAAQTRTNSIAELAASVAELVPEVDDRSDLDAALTSSIGWSYRLLPDDAQRALRGFSVFRGDVQLEGCATVLGGAADEGSIVESVGQLLDRQLLRYDDDTKRLTASPSIRSFAASRFAAAEAAERRVVTERHADWFADLAEGFAVADPALPLSLLAPDEADVVAALRHSLAVDDVDRAYRLLGSAGAVLGHPSHLDTVESAARWVAARPPSDGEQRWSAAVAAVSSVFADHPEHPIHSLGDEALAIAEIGGDRATVAVLQRLETGRTVPEVMAPPP